MPIDRLEAYRPHHALPLYIKITDPKFNQYDVGTVYDIQVEDTERARESDQDPPFNDVHKSLLVAKRELKFKDLHPLIMAFETNSRDTELAMDRIVGKGIQPEDDDNIVMLIYLRIDKTKDFIVEGGDAIKREFEKEDAES